MEIISYTWAGNRFTSTRIINLKKKRLSQTKLTGRDSRNELTVLKRTKNITFNINHSTYGMYTRFSARTCTVHTATSLTGVTRSNTARCISVPFSTVTPRCTVRAITLRYNVTQREKKITLRVQHAVRVPQCFPHLQTTKL